MKRTRKCKKHINVERVVLKDGTTRCPICLEEKNKKIINSCIEKAKQKHGDSYDYSLVSFKTIYEKVKIICKKHGIFEQHIYNHIKGNNCPMCELEKKKNSFENIIEKFENVHDKKYNYSLVNYVNYKTKVKIICAKHGIFEQTPEKHICGQGCPVCKYSKGENEIRNFLKKHKIKYKPQKKFDGCVNPTSKVKLKFDFYLPDYNLCIEYDGEQHFEEKFYTLKSGGLERIRMNDKTKNEYCKINSIRLLRINYGEFKNIEEILKNNIYNV